MCERRGGWGKDILCVDLLGVDCAESRENLIRRLPCPDAVTGERRGGNAGQPYQQVFLNLPFRFFGF